MVISHLVLKNFRNYKELSLPLHPKINFFVGRNGQGKTNLIEALFFFAHLKSFRSHKPQKVVYLGADSSFMELEFTKQNIQHRARIFIHKNGKRVELDNKLVSKSSVFAKDFYSTLFSPDQVFKFREYPSARRRFFDRVLTLLLSDYLLRMQDFLRIQKHKNCLLKENKKNEILAWNQLLSKIIPQITASRKKIVQSVNDKLPWFFFELTGRQEELFLVFRDNLEEYEEDSGRLLQFLTAKVFNELNSRSMLYGPHKDQYWLTLNGQVDKDVFSQGEYRIAVLALCLVLNEMIIQEQSFFPVLLMDDVFSELDQYVSDKVIDFIYKSENQVFITTTSVPQKYQSLGAHFHIEEGKVVDLVVN